MTKMTGGKGALFHAQKVLCVLLSNANGDASSARRDEKL